MGGVWLCGGRSATTCHHHSVEVGWKKQASTANNLQPRRDHARCSHHRPLACSLWLWLACHRQQEVLHNERADTGCAPGWLVTGCAPGWRLRSAAAWRLAALGLTGPAEATKGRRNPATRRPPWKRRAAIGCLSSCQNGCVILRTPSDRQAVHKERLIARPAEEEPVSFMHDLPRRRPSISGSRGHVS
jgi:hypothetical protein